MIARYIEHRQEYGGLSPTNFIVDTPLVMLGQLGSLHS
jgi:hypothetical protein